MTRYPCPGGRLPRSGLILVAVLLAAAPWLWTGCSHQVKGLSAVQRAIEQGKWLTAGELATRLKTARPQDADVERTLAQLRSRAGQAARASDFDPKRYFYAQAYLDYFEKQRYLKAIDDLEQVLTCELENEEVLQFMDKAQALADRERKNVSREVSALLRKSRQAEQAGKTEEALRTARRAAELDPASATVGARIKDLSPAETAPDPESLESRYQQSLKAYVNGDLSKARGIMREILRNDPKNIRWQKSLQRMEQELPH